MTFFNLAAKRAAQPNGLLKMLDKAVALRLLRGYSRSRELKNSRVKGEAQQLSER